MKKILIVGGGAAGLMAAGRAAEKGASVTVLEKMAVPGRKLLITGKGRCNLTNTAHYDEFMERFGRGGRFLRSAFGNFFAHDLVSFFTEHNVPTVVERGGRIFPTDNRAESVVQALVAWCTEKGVQFKTGVRVKGLMIDNGCCTGVHLEHGKDIEADAVIIATGGASYPGTGSSGDGYRLAEQAGHTIVEIMPALIPLVTKGTTAQDMQGLSLKNVAVRVYIKGKKKGEHFGEMLFTHFGVSGPVILTLSGMVVSALRKNHPVELSIDLKPALSEEKLDRRLLRELDGHGKMQVVNLLKNLMPRTMIPICMTAIGMPAERQAHQVTAQERKKLRVWLKDLRLSVTGNRPLKEAIVTAGGVDIRQVAPKTMESKLVAGLYFVGEVLNIQGETGGYNLQAAFSTGRLAGEHAPLPRTES